MTDEWVEKRVADLEVGDDVKGWGVMINRYLPPAHLPDLYTVFFGDDPETSEHWPAHARVDVRRPVEVRVYPWLGAHNVQRAHIYIGKQLVGSLALQPAEEYAERLRGSAAERAKALGR